MIPSTTVNVVITGCVRYLTAMGHNYTDWRDSGKPGYVRYIDEVFPNFNEKGYRPV